MKQFPTANTYPQSDTFTSIAATTLYQQLTNDDYRQTHFSIRYDSHVRCGLLTINSSAAMTIDGSLTLHARVRIGNDCPRRALPMIADDDRCRFRPRALTLMQIRVRYNWTRPTSQR